MGRKQKLASVKRRYAELIRGIVVDKTKVELQGVVCSLTEATRKLLNMPNGAAIQPSPHWLFNGRTVKEIYEGYHSQTNAD
ncbi:hypothetical protein [uncultured Thiothrix sp.]|uniref:hypothetical protein n=1 Tax=uncultured Thiothrix sp. TaxID=223185 RepID=UPI00261646BD|nr:hypothetical protein [uncultured Thiothrix sp.]